ncbi:MAG: hypothetical protein JSU63_04000 [Phycisphaerales bacterium]|nr:MAG: hypothetical protein JSU63_04000 [Phycisphaerales bacterium]
MALCAGAAVLGISGLGCGIGIAHYEFPVYTVKLDVLDAQTLDTVADAEVELLLRATGENDRTLRSFDCEIGGPVNCTMGNWEGQPIGIFFPFVGRRYVEIGQLEVTVTHDGCRETQTFDLNEDTVEDLDYPGHSLVLAVPVLITPCGDQP